MQEKKWVLNIIYTTPFPDDNCFHTATETYIQYEECLSAIKEIQKLYNRIGYKLFSAAINKVGNADYLAEFIPLH